jgi:hypothetical protein
MLSRVSRGKKREEKLTEYAVITERAVYTVVSRTVFSPSEHIFHDFSRQTSWREKQKTRWRLSHSSPRKSINFTATARQIHLLDDAFDLCQPASLSFHDEISLNYADKQAD